LDGLISVLQIPIYDLILKSINLNWEGEMKNNYLTIVTLVLVLTLLVCGCASKAVVTTEKTTSWTWQPTPGGVIPGAQWAYFPLEGANVETGRTLSLTWSANSNMDCYIFTNTQYDAFTQSGTPGTYIAHGTDSQGTISTNTLQSGTYYAVLVNAATDFGVEVKLYQATLTEQ
jgi:hypothetical protein